MNKKFLPLLFAVIVFILALVLLQPAPQIPVVTAALDMPAGHTIVQSDLIMVSLPENAVPEGAVADIKSVVGQTLKGDRSKGDLITTAHLGAQSVLLQPNERAVAVTVRDSTGLSGLLKPGNRVGVIGVMRSSNGLMDGAFSKVTVENLRVLYLTPNFKALDPADATSGTIVTPDPATGIAEQRERVREGVVILAVPTHATAIVYDFTQVAMNTVGEKRFVNAIELLAALDASSEASLSLYLMPDDAQPFASSGLFLPDLVITPGATSDLTSTTNNPDLSLTATAVSGQTPTVMITGTP